MAEDDTAAAAPVTGEVECPVCGGKAQPGEVICNFCGTRLTPDSAESASEAATARVRRAPETPESFVPASERSPSRGFQTTPIAEAGGDEGGHGILGVVGFIAAAIIALVAGGWFALYLSHRNRPAPIAEASPSPSPAAAVSPMVVLAKTIPIQVNGDLAATLQRDPKTLAQVFADNNAGLTDVYRDALDATPGLSNGMILRLHILPDGSVGDGSVRISTAPNPSLDAEVVKVMSGWKFAPATGVGVTADFPVVFVTKDADIAGIEADLKTKLASLGPNEAPEYALSPATPAGSPAASPSTGVASLESPGVEAAPAPPAVSAPPRRRHHHAASALASAPPPEPLGERVTNELAGNRKLRRVQAYTNGGNVTLTGRVFDDSDKLLAEQTVRSVSGVGTVTDDLTTDTAQWVQDSNTINQQLQAAGLGGVTAKVIGKTAYLSGTVKTDLERERAVGVAQAAARVTVRENLIRVDAGGLF
jgi:TonB family protein